MIESESFDMRIGELKLQVQGMIETFGKSKATQKIKYTEYIYMWLSLHECKISSSISKKP